ncbi:MAG: phosphoglycerate dehydrogenase [Flammeovirgaceae bacterium]
MEQKRYFILDFDSTFTQVEALDELCEIAQKNNPNRDEILAEIKQTTDLAMEGKLSFRESLEKRLSLLNANKKHIPSLISTLKSKVSTSIERNKQFFESYAGQVHIISNGFKDFIDDIVADYGIVSDHVHANTFEFDEADNIIGFDKENPLSESGGKVKVIQSLNLSDGEIYVIGDGYNDYEIKGAGFANKFYAFTENVERDIVKEKADHIAPSFDEVLYVNKLPMAISYPKNRIKVLLLENIHPNAKEVLETEGYQVELRSSAMDETELIEHIKDVSILGIRSKTHVTRKVLEHANRLMVVGAFCIGTNQIDLDACLEKGVVVFNAPFSNTRSVVELAIGEIIMLMRGIPDKNRDMHVGKWSKTAVGSNEIRGKKLGIIGSGNIGAQLSVVAEAFGMDVYYYDLVEKLAMGNATKCTTLEELLRIADIVTLHVDGRPENKNFFGEKQFSQMKDGAVFLNLARGFVVDIPALVKYIKNGKLKGAGVDVFPKEPKNNTQPFESELIGLPNLILTPHIGGSTLEAQENIASFVPNAVIKFINTGNTFNSVNYPNVQLPTLKNAHRLLHVHKNVSGVIADITNVLAKHNINIIGQYLKTNEIIGYMIVDIDKEYNQEVIKDLKAIKNTIKFRVLY